MSTLDAMRARLPGAPALLRAAAALVLGAAVLEPIRDEDFFWHLATGRWIASSGRPPTTDIFAVDGPALPWVAHEWLYELFLYGLHQLGGMPLLALLPSLAAVLCAAILLAETKRRDVPAAIAAPVVLLALLPSHEYWVQRPQLLTYGFLATFLVLLAGHEAGRRRLPLVLLPLTVVWANLHAAVALAPLVVFAFFAGAALQAPFRAEARPRALGLLGLLVGVLAAGALNPQGVGLWTHVLGYGDTGWIAVAIREWDPIDFHDPRRLAWAAVVLFAFVAAALGRVARVGELFAFAGLTIMALRWQRHAPLALIAAAPLAAAGLAAWLRALRERPDAKLVEPPPPLPLGLAHVVVLAALAALAVAARWPCRDGVCEEPQRFPRGALAHLHEYGDPPGRLVNHYNWGGWLLWHRPGRAVFVDGRTVDIDRARLQAYATIHAAGSGLEAAIEADRVGWVLYPPAEPLVAALLERGFSIAFRSETAVIVVSGPSVAQ